ncbi:MAG: cell division protein FtsZ [Candidatus Woesearchaeota archaeon]|nr:cell division protein FtsZ [Candidatus Woesearchaeota archaeon]MDN5327484.1 cell division protein FtsZ [Candidatus Woesearchaeota archaeon]
MDSFVNAAIERAGNEKVENVSGQKFNKKENPLDRELEKLLNQHKATIKVVGVGGAGNNTLNRINEVGIVGIETIAINTDAQDLLYTNADVKILIGKDLTKGHGAGSNPKIGEEAAKENENDIREALKNADMVFITCGLGGGTGTGAAPVVAELSKKQGSLTIGVATLPFEVEGNTRYQNALYGLQKLRKSVDTLILIPNDKLLQLVPNLPLHVAFKVADEILTNAVKGIAEMVTRPGLVNLDFADIKAVMNDGGVSLIGVGESDSENRALEAVEKALNNPLIDVDVNGATGALVNISGGPDLTLEEAKQVVQAVSDKLDEDAKLIWGAQIYDDLDKALRVMVIVTGVKSSQIISQRDMDEKLINDLAEDLGIEFVD